MPVSKKKKGKNTKRKRPQRKDVIKDVKLPTKEDMLAYDTVLFDIDDMSVLAEKVIVTDLNLKDRTNFELADVVDFCSRNMDLFLKPSLRYFNVVIKDLKRTADRGDRKMVMFFSPVTSSAIDGATLDCSLYLKTEKSTIGLYMAVMSVNMKEEGSKRFKFTKVFKHKDMYASEGANFDPYQFVYIYSMVQIMLLNSFAEVIEEALEDDSVPTEGISKKDDSVSTEDISKKEEGIVEVSKQGDKPRNTKNSVVYVGRKKYVYKKGSLNKIKRKPIITCPVWGVRGHWRVYKKTGKRVWIEPYKKGKERNNSSEYVSKTYVVNIDEDTGSIGGE